MSSAASAAKASRCCARIPPPTNASRISSKLAATLQCECRPLGIDWPAVQTATKEWKAAQ